MQPVHRGRAAFGNRLRGLREEARLTGSALAARLGWVASKVSKLEHGKQTPTVDDVTAWVRALELGDDVLTDLLTDLRSVRIEHRSWARFQRRGVAARQQASASLDAPTSRLRAFEVAAIPGLLQTAEYAHAVLSQVIHLRQIPDDAAAGVQARMERQRVLYDSGRHFQFLITESALRNLVCEPRVLRGQLDRLLAIASLDTVELAVVPHDARLPFPPTHGFWIYDDRLVLVDTVSAELALRDQDDVSLYERLFALTWQSALTGRAATRFIANLGLPS